MVDLPGEDLIICVACGTQYDVTYEQGLERCKICDDPRQFVPPTGQQWTSLRRERGRHTNHWERDARDDRIWHMWTEPKLGIGQRASLLKTSHGSIIWDCFAYIDQPLIDFIKSQSPLHAMIISHPHFYTTHLTWSAALSSLPVYLSPEDAPHLSRADPSGLRRFLTSSPSSSSSSSSSPTPTETTTTTTILPDVTAVRVGGHFEGSLVLHWDRHLFVADSIMTTPAAHTPDPRPEGMGAYSFMWSIPNMIPLGPAEVVAIWDAVKGLEFDATHGLMRGMDVRDPRVKGWVLEAAQRQVRMMGHGDHPFLRVRL